MLIILLPAGAALLALPALARPVGRRLAPSEWARLCAVALGGGAALLELTALLHAAPTVLRTAGAVGLASLCERMLGPLAPGGAPAGWAAGAAALTLPALAAIGARRAVRERRALWCEPGLGEHHDHGAYELVVLPTPKLVAVSVPGFPRGRIVVSEGLVETLEPAEVEAVLRHELAHLTHGHDRYLLLATALEHSFAFVPLLRRSTRTLRVTLERWADEEAAGSSPESRRAVKHALLGVSSALVADPSVAAFSAADAVIERIEALADDKPRPAPLSHLALYLPGTALASVAGYVFLTWGVDAERVLAMAGSCYA